MCSTSVPVAASTPSSPRQKGHKSWPWTMCHDIVMGDTDEAVIAMTGLVLEDLHAITDRLEAALERLAQ